ncbi:LANO_0H24190g1_1 [Lachancea nothofagi CBS 11611]|uniref:LANO_0H24190g1_1 n=1 Tax=Lachancea nothofagi CBS 11611 TaxID=1266666 RepID=A0A1G4KNW5_9SACH|nr:LANO_0H24190g1_1 [Lachancea nothofagi CBS 11611]
MFQNAFKRAFGRSSKISPKYRLYSQSFQYQRFNNKQSKSFSQLLVDPTSRKYLAFALGGGSLFYITHLEEAPVTGRTRFMWLPRSLELKIGNYSYNSMLGQTKGSILPANNPLTVKVTKIFDRIVDAAQRDPSIDKQLLEGVNWQIHIVDDPKAPPNAFVLPGGKVFVFSSILGICKNDDGLATVLSHEFAHQLARHTAENLSKAPIYSILGAILYTVTGADIFNRLILDGFLKMPASRQMETEADHIGLMIMSRACFHPQEAVKLWGRMAEFERRVKGSGNFSPEFLSTHPASDRRIENMQSWMPKAQELYSQSSCGTGGYYDSFHNIFSGQTRGEGPVFTWG